MEKIYNQRFDETYYKETLDNGLNVVIFNKPDYDTTMACFALPYGSNNIKQISLGKEYSFNPGVAHFLEHKLFETKGKDIMNKFASLGASVNAFTANDITNYFFVTSSKDVTKELNLLLDFVQDLDITDKSVEKEKDIICEELQMYLKRPDQRLVNETFKSLYKEYPINIDIGGTEDSVRKITCKELYDCYNINYHPSNMTLVIVSPINQEKLLNIIRDNQSKKQFIKKEKPITIFNEEPYEVNRKEYTFNMDVNKTKTCYAFKLNNQYDNNLQALKDHYCLYFYLETYFSELNENYQNWLDKQIINDFFSYDISITKQAGFFLFSNENDDKNVLKELVDNEFKKDLFTKEIFEQIKHRVLGDAFREFNNIEDFCIEYTRYAIQDIDYLDVLEMILNISYEDVLCAIKKIDFNNYALIHIESDKK